MSSQLIKGKEISASIQSELTPVIEGYLSSGRKINIAIIYFGNDPSAESYIKSKEKTFKKFGIAINLFNFPETTEKATVLKKIHELNTDPDCKGIMIEMPVPGQFDKLELFSEIYPSKDIDCLTPYNYGRLLLGYPGPVPATAGAVIEVIKRSGFELSGKNVTVVGRSNIVGKPLALLLLRENSTVTVCHTKTKNLPEKTKQADIVVVSAGKPKLLGEEYFRKESIVIDVGINFLEGKLCGDVDYDNVSEKVKAITPVPGGVGPVTSIFLIKNLTVLMGLSK
ncbi:MAG: bifunctional 5,10-methylenetetrahydrofolate dehydrogenase/5,10-methenyltetrahydrofolate cyclohydrolase [bacterium]|nr:bifunctional 5,10-methylenetetrahydrofolate dehydrogenase/5,10-methenyltetrahydrofolate cyclohydrolase [bacterium]